MNCKNFFYFIFFLRFINATNLRKTNEYKTINKPYNDSSLEFNKNCTSIFGIKMCGNYTNLYSNLYSNLVTIVINTINVIKINLHNVTTTNTTNYHSIYNETSPNVIVNSYRIKEIICPNYTDYNMLLPIYFELAIKNIFRPDSVFKYYVSTDYGCTYYQMAGLQPASTLLNVPLSVGDVYQQSPSITIYRYYGGNVDNSTLSIYNPKNILQIRPVFFTYISNNELYIFPWISALQNIYLNVNVNNSDEYTSIYIQKMGITKIEIIFEQISNLINVKDLHNYLIMLHKSGFIYSEL